MDVLEETVKYIESLERRLLERVRLSGLPARLHKLQPTTPGDDAGDGRLHLPTIGSSENPVGPVRTGGGGGLEIQDLRNLLHHSLQPALEQKLKKQRMEDDAMIRQLLEERLLTSSKQ